MIEIDITREQIEKAEELFSFRNLKNSITKGESQIYGALGEIVVLDYYKQYGVHSEYVGSFDYDIIIANKKVDVKTKKVNNPPQMDHNATIPAVNTFQKTDIYYFVYVLSDMTKAYLIGWLYKEEFFNKAELKRSGEVDRLGWTFKTDTYVTQLKNLNIIHKK